MGAESGVWKVKSGVWRVESGRVKSAGSPLTDVLNPHPPVRPGKIIPDFSLLIPHCLIALAAHKNLWYNTLTRLSG